MKALLMTVALLGLVAGAALAQAPDPLPTTNTWSGTGTVGAYATFKASVLPFATVTILPPADFTIPSGAMGTQHGGANPTDVDDLGYSTFPSKGAGGAIDFETNCSIKSDIEVFELNSMQGETWEGEPAPGERLYTLYKLGAMWDAFSMDSTPPHVWFPRYTDKVPLKDWTQAYDGTALGGMAGSYGGTKLVADLPFDPGDARYARIWWGVDAWNKARNADSTDDARSYTMPPEARDYYGVMIVTLHP